MIDYGCTLIVDVPPSLLFGAKLNENIAKKGNLLQKFISSK